MRRCERRRAVRMEVQQIEAAQKLVREQHAGMPTTPVNGGMHSDLVNRQAQ